MRADNVARGASCRTEEAAQREGFAAAYGEAHEGAGRAG